MRVAATHGASATAVAWRLAFPLKGWSDDKVNPADEVPVVGTPLAYGIGFLVLLLVVFAGPWGASLVTVAHEGGHAVVGVLTFRGLKGFNLYEDGGGDTDFDRLYWSVSDLFMRFAGYPMPSLLGWGGADLTRRGHLETVLWLGLLLLLASFFIAANQLAIAITLIATLLVGWIALAGSPVVQAATAVTLVWWMLIGGAIDATVWLSRADGSDAAMLARRTWVPRIVWHGLWAAIAIVSLWKGGKALLAA